ncbi:MAG: nicotinate phosphoribosyltransferase [Treponema sp.]|jgi:nicotinate phosphoribosyltransferase|nr:nicotinate phosphoribosyltransferase [Treponema sp.]
MKDSALFTDFYSLTMAQGYWRKGMDGRSVFEMYFRTQPFGGGFSIFAGLGTLLEKLLRFSFSEDDLNYLKMLGVFEDAFLDYLKAFRFSGSLWAMEEGTVVFPNEPLIRVEGSLIECQIIEGMLLNIINFQSLIATKTARVWLASGKGTVVEFGLRRAQGPDGALSASRAAYIGGAAGTSNVLAGKEFGIPVVGTMAHSWIMAWPGEEEAFRAYAELYPDNTVFLIDTYDTLKSGMVNAIKVGKTLAAKGKSFGVRLDSGDIHYLSMEVRKMLDAAGLKDASISVSNDLDETIIQALTDAEAPVNTWGVGTKMVTGGGEAAFSGVYKLEASGGENGKLIPKIKFSDNPEKTTNPGVKQVWRIRDTEGMAVADVLALEDPTEPDIIEKGKTYSFWHPSADYRRFVHTLDGSAEPLLAECLRNGTLCQGLTQNATLDNIRDNVRRELESFDQSYRRILNPHIYKVSVTGRIRALKLELIKNYLGEL